MRGFNYNKRTGPKYVLFNSELRVPIIQYLSRKPITSGFFRNLQLTAFGDAGSAYSGSNPFNENNSFNTQITGGNGNAFTATVINFRNPLLLGYGAGIRTTLLGFYGKADIAWGQEDYVQKGPKFYFSLGYDF
jgi:outer membrane translocation and assembly module TamA